MGEQPKVSKEIKTLEGITQEVHVVPQELSPFTITSEGEIIGKEVDHGFFQTPKGKTTNQKVAQRIYSGIGRDDKGKYYFLEREANGKLVQTYLKVEDTAYFVQVIKINFKKKSIEVMLNDDTKEELRPETMVYEDDRLYCTVKGDHKAKLLRTPYMDFILAYDKLVAKKVKFPKLHLDF